MKKFLLSAAVIVLFIIYSFNQHQNPASVNPIVPVVPSPNSPSSPQSSSKSTYKDGQYTGSVADAYYGNIQVKAIINSGKIKDVQFLQYPNDRPRSVAINTQAMPYLTSEAIQVQNANVDIVTGATDTSQAFIQSLQSALTHASQ